MTEFTITEPQAQPAILGQNKAENWILKAASMNRLPHAVGVYGAFGIGKATFSFRVARWLIAGRPEADTLSVDPDHRAFRLIAQGSHPDLIHVTPPDTNVRQQRKEIPVDTIRAAAERLRATSMEGGARVLIVEQADLLNMNAANALLKVLEEPGPETFMFLTAPQPGRLLATIRSRLLPLSLKPVETDLMADFVDQAFAGTDVARRNRLARQARGCPGQAVQLASLGWTDRYDDALQMIMTKNARTERVLALGRLWSEFAEKAGLPMAFDLISVLIRRAVDRQVGRPLSDDNTAEDRCLDHLQRPLDRWLELWDKLGDFARSLDPLSLNRRQVFTLLADELVPRT
ncbi:MAG: hypothetical protein ACFB6S_06495 [Geminicoccaceae bacterium]